MKLSGSKSSKSNSTSIGRSSLLSAREKAIQEMVRVAKLQTETSFMKKNRVAGMAELLRFEEKKARPRVKIYDKKNQDQEMALILPRLGNLAGTRSQIF